jgi:AraC-like DNA-binding protein
MPPRFDYCRFADGGEQLVARGEQEIACMHRTLRTVNHMNGHGTPSQPRRYRADTEAFHRQAVERAVSAIRQRFAEEDIGLSAIAAEAIRSPFHFSRVFRRVSGCRPVIF